MEALCDDIESLAHSLGNVGRRRSRVDQLQRLLAALALGIERLLADGDLDLCTDHRRRAPGTRTDLHLRSMDGVSWRALRKKTKIARTFAA